MPCPVPKDLLHRHHDGGVEVTIIEPVWGGAVGLIAWQPRGVGVDQIRDKRDVRALFLVELIKQALKTRAAILEVL